MVSLPSADNLPAELVNRQQWLIWAGAKVPHHARTGKTGDAHDRKAWVSFEEAVRAVKRWNASGVGISTPLDGDLWFLDLDHCLDAEGEPAPWALPILDALDSYSEISPSGRGIKAIFYGKALPLHCDKVALQDRGMADEQDPGEQWEIYGAGAQQQYTTITGKRRPDAPLTLSDGSAVLAVLQHTAKPKPGEERKPSTPSSQGQGERPGDAYSRAMAGSDVVALLVKAGWAELGRRGNNYYLTRPGKQAGISGSVLVDRGTFYPFTSSSAFEPGRGYSPFAVYAEVEHNGDYSAAARALAAKGYGDPLPAPTPLSRIAPKTQDKPLPVSLLLKRLGEGEAGDAQLLTQIIGGQLLYEHSLSRNAWYEYDGVVWKQKGGEPRSLVWSHVASLYLEAAAVLTRQAGELPDSEKGTDAHAAKVKILEQIELLTERAKKLRSRSRIDAVLALAREEGLLGRFNTAFDQAPHLIATPTGVVDLRTGELLEGNPEWYMTKQTKAEWKGLNEPAPRWERFISEMMGGKPDEVTWLQRVLGYALNGTQHLHLLVLLVGAEGRNGKGTLFGTLTRYVLGTDYATPVQPEVIIASGRPGEASGHQAHLMPLRGARIAYVDETNDRQVIDAGTVKRITGDNEIRARDLHQSPQVISPTWTLFLSTNREPQIDQNDDAALDRVRVIRLIHRWTTPGERKADYPAELQHDADPLLKQRLEAEASGILAWLVRGSIDYHRYGLHTPTAMRLAKESYRMAQGLKGFLNSAYAELHASLECSATTAYEAYTRWCATVGIKRPQSQHWFGRQLLQEPGIEKGRSTTGRTVYYGLAVSVAAAFEPKKVQKVQDVDEKGSGRIETPKNGPSNRGVSEPSEPFTPVSDLSQGKLSHEGDKSEKGSEGSEGSEGSDLLARAKRLWPNVEKIRDTGDAIHLVSDTNGILCSYRNLAALRADIDERLKRQKRGAR